MSRFARQRASRSEGVVPHTGGETNNNNNDRSLTAGKSRNPLIYSAKNFTPWYSGRSLLSCRSSTDEYTKAWILPQHTKVSVRALKPIGSFPIFNLFYYFIITLFIVEFSKYPAKYQKKISLVLTLSNIRIVATIFIRVWIFLEYRFTNRFLNSLS